MCSNLLDEFNRLTIECDSWNSQVHKSARDLKMEISNLKNRFSAKFWDSVLTIYGRGTPCHPGKWRVLNSLTGRALPAWIAPRTALYNGIRFELDLSDHMQRHIYFRDFDPLETRFLRKTIKRGWVAVDAGANVGYYSVLISQLVGTGGLVYAFEPSEDNWQKLSKTIALNSSTNVHACKLALSDSCGKASIVPGPRGNSGKAHLGDTETKGCDFADQTTLDSFAAQNHLGRLDIIKVDIEGCEERFLVGGAKTIDRFKPVLLMELNPGALEGFGTTAENLIARLHGFGYQLFRLTWMGLAPFSQLAPGSEFINVVGIAQS
jgi:FkbM family methyltransferase